MVKRRRSALFADWGTGAGRRRCNPVDYLIAFPLLGLIVMLLPAIALMKAFQVQAGVSFTPGEIVGSIAGFAVLGLFAIWVAAAILRRILDSVPES